MYKLNLFNKYDPLNDVVQSLNDNKWSSWTNYIADVIYNDTAADGCYGKFFRYGDATALTCIENISVRIGNSTTIGDYSEANSSYYNYANGIMCFFNSDDKPNLCKGKEFTGELSSTLDNVGYKGYFKEGLFLVYLDKKVENTDVLLVEMLTIYHNITKNTRNKKPLADAFIELINTSHNVDDYDEFIRTKILMAGIDTFINNIKTYRYLLLNEEFNNKLDTYMYAQQLLKTIDYYKKMVKECATDCKKFITNYDFGNMKDNSENFLTALNRFKDLSVTFCDNNSIDISINTYLRTWSKSDLKILLKNEHSNLRLDIISGVDDGNQRLNLFVDIFFHKKYKIKICQGVTFSLTESNGWDINARDRCDFRIGFPNPHLYFYNCFADAQRHIKDCFKIEDYETGFAQLLAAVQSITVNDRLTMQRFIKSILFNSTYENRKYLIDKDGNAFSVKELLDGEYKDKTDIPDFDNLIEKDVAKETL